MENARTLIKVTNLHAKTSPLHLINLVAHNLLQIHVHLMIHSKNALLKLKIQY